MSFDIWSFDILSVDILSIDILSVDILSSDILSVDILSFDILSVDILRFRYFGFRYYALRYFAYSIFCVFDILRLDILRLRYSAISIFCLSISCVRYFAIRYFAFRYFVMEAFKHPPVGRRLTRAPLQWGATQCTGGIISSPPLVFLRYLLNQCRYHHQTCCTLSPNHFTHCVKILKYSVSYFGHKWRQSDVMFRRFRPKIRVYGNRRHGCSFKATINVLIWNDEKLVGLQNCYLRYWKFWKFPKISKIFSIFFQKKKIPSKQNFQQTVYYVRGQWLMNMCTKFQVDTFKNGWDMT